MPPDPVNPSGAKSSEFSSADFDDGEAGERPGRVATRHSPEHAACRSGEAVAFSGL